MSADEAAQDLKTHGTHGVMACGTHDAPARIRASWERNAAAWIDAVRERRIESRRIATDAAIVARVCALAPRRVLDVGCGEGWLCRALGDAGVTAVGIDGTPSLVEAAIAHGADAHHVDYDSLAADPLRLGRFDCAVCNFSLFERDLGALLGALATLLRPDGRLLVQTVHPGFADDGGDDGWRVDTCATLGPGFSAPSPWYRRRPAAWSAAFTGAGLDAPAVDTVRHPGSGAPLSIILDARVRPEPPAC